MKKNNLSKNAVDNKFVYLYKPSSGNMPNVSMNPLSERPVLFYYKNKNNSGLTISSHESKTFKKMDSDLNTYQLTLTKIISIIRILYIPMIRV